MEVVDGLRSIDEAGFTGENVYNFLSDHPIQAGSISRYLHWSEKFYTRNLIFRNEQFEMMAVCWAQGQASRVHNHSEQQCWMTVPMGRLLGQNFAVETIDESIGHCKLRETNTFELSECIAAKVDLDEPIHQVLNIEEYGERAVSIHIYAKPYDKCLAYCRDTDTFKEIPLFYTSIDGRLCDGIVL